MTPIEAYCEIIKMQDMAKSMRDETTTDDVGMAIYRIETALKEAMGRVNDVICGIPRRQ